MLSSLHRFHGLNSLSYAYKHGQVVRGAQLALKYTLNKRRQTYRASVVVSRKVDKSAVVRNRIRRRIYEIIRTYAEQIQQPYDLVFTAYSSQLADLDHKTLTKLVGDSLKRAGVLTPPTNATPHGIVNPRK